VIGWIRSTWRAARTGRCILVLWVTLLAGAIPAFAQTEPAYPRLANMYLHGGYDPGDVPALARWDVLILDPLWTREDLQRLRQINPDIKLFFYVCAYCLESPPPGDTWRQVNYDYAVANDMWWRNWNQTVASDWPGSQMANITELCPAGPQGNWRQFMAGRVAELMDQFPELDGVFYDNYWKSISWEQGGTIQVDSDCSPARNPAGCNGLMDSDATVDSLWNAALTALAQETRTRFDVLTARRGGRPLAVISNSSTDYFPYLNGTLHEYFPTASSNPDPGNTYGYNWNQEMLAQPGGYLVAPFRSTPYTVSVLNADWRGTWAAPSRSADFERHKRFTLASALMGDGYYSLDAARDGHGSLWWEPEFDHGGRGKGYLGYPLGPMHRVGVPNGPELVTNGSFATSLQSWDTLAWHCTGSATVDPTVYNTAPASVKVTLSNLQQADGSFKLYQTVNVQGGHGYTLAFWARASVAQNISLHLYGNSCPGIRCLSDQTLPLTAAWQRYEIPFVASGSDAAGLNLFVTTPGTVWFDDITLREGDASVYRRDFENGIVLLNYTTSPQAVDLGGSFKHLSIAGSPYYDGTTVTVETLAPSDGRILLSASAPVPTPPPASQTRLEQNAPNPFNPTTRIRYQVAQNERVHLAIYDLRGRLVRTLVNRVVPGGVERNVSWNGLDRFGMRVPSGVYYYRMVTPSTAQTKKLTLLK